jgi:hypothetical protein
MGRAKTPQQKKQESYAHDRIEGAEYPHSARRNRPRVKAFGQREIRHIAKQLLSSQPEEVLQLPARTRWRPMKSAVPLPEHLESTRRQRIEREAHNLFRKGYSPATHARFRRVIESWIQGGSEQSASLAEFYVSVLNAFPGETWGSDGRSMAPRRDFLNQFFDREPALKRSFQQWISTLRSVKKRA